MNLEGIMHFSTFWHKKINVLGKNTYLDSIFGHIYDCAFDGQNAVKMLLAKPTLYAFTLRLPKMQSR